MSWCSIDTFNPPTESFNTLFGGARKFTGDEVGSNRSMHRSLWAWEGALRHCPGELREPVALQIAAQFSKLTWTVPVLCRTGGSLWRYRGLSVRVWDYGYRAPARWAGLRNRGLSGHCASLTGYGFKLQPIGISNAFNRDQKDSFKTRMNQMPWYSLTFTLMKVRLQFISGNPIRR